MLNMLLKHFFCSQTIRKQPEKLALAITCGVAVLGAKNTEGKAARKLECEEKYCMIND
jgi:hypothetical protein